MYFAINFANLITDNLKFYDIKKCMRRVFSKRKDKQNGKEGDKGIDGLAVLIYKYIEYMRCSLMI